MYYSILRPLLFSLPPEVAHALTLRVLPYLQACGICTYSKTIGKQPRAVMGLNFANPYGIAAGLDKNAEHIDALGNLGFGFIEVGTVTPKPQVGNPQPRLFRLPNAHGLINRMGFNNKGVHYAVKKLQRRTY